ncbi:MAG: hypothetical protein ABI536_04465 [Gallionella sp.]
MGYAERIYERVKKLSDRAADEVLDFAEFVASRHQSKATASDDKAVSAQRSAEFGKNIRQVPDRFERFQVRPRGSECPTLIFIDKKAMMPNTDSSSAKYQSMRQHAYPHRDRMHAFVVRP